MIAEVAVLPIVELGHAARAEPPSRWLPGSGTLVLVTSCVRCVTNGAAAVRVWRGDSAASTNALNAPPSKGMAPAITGAIRDVVSN